MILINYLVAMALLSWYSWNPKCFILYDILYRIEAIILIYTGIILVILYIQSIGSGIGGYGLVVLTNIYFFICVI